MADETDTPDIPEEGAAPGLPDESAVEAVEEAAAAEPDANAGAQPSAEPEPVLAPKERRQRARAARAAKTPTSGPRTAQERQAQRDTERQRKAAARRHERQRTRAKQSRTGDEAQATPPREHGPGRQKTRQGIVVSDRAAKTITVRIDTARRHRRYQKIVRSSSTLHAHDEQGEAHIGDTVIVRESRPLSRTKRWRLVQVVERAE